MGSLSDKDRLRLAELIAAPRHGAEPSTSPPPIAGRILSAARFVRPWMWWTVASAFVLCVVLFGVAKVPRHQSSTLPIQFGVTGQNGRMLAIRWNPQADAIRNATAAKLYIVDGGNRIFVNLDTSHLNSGTVMYPRQSAVVKLSLSLSEPGGKLVEERASFGEAAPAITPSASPRQLEAAARPPSADPAIARSQPIIPAQEHVEHRARKRPLVTSGPNLPFTCSAGDLFHKTTAAAGWDTFQCRSKNVWSLVRDTPQVSAPQPGAIDLTAKPAAIPNI